MQVDFEKLQKSLAPLFSCLQKVASFFGAILPKFPQLSYHFFLLEEQQWRIYAGSEGEIESAPIESFPEREGLWVRILPWKSTFHQDLKLAFQKNRRELIPFQMEPLLPFGIEQVEFSYLPLGESQELLWVCAIQKKDLLAIQNQTQGWHADAFISPLFALVEAHQNFFASREEPILYLHKEGERLVFALMDRKKVWGVRQVDLTGKQLEPNLVALESKRTLFFLQAAEETQRIWLGEAELQSIDPGGKGNRLYLPKGFLLFGAQRLMESRARYEAVLDRRSSGLLAKIAPWIQGVVVVSTALLLAFSFKASLYQHQQIRRQKKEAQRIVEQAQKKQIRLPDLTEFSSIRSWSKETEAWMEKKLSPYPLKADLPSPTDTIGWIADVASIGDSHIRSFEYKTESFPDSKHSKAHYRVKIELELEVQDPSLAEAIQQKFLKAYDWIESPSALVWKAKRDRYHVGFYLKDKTVYVE